MMGFTKTLTKAPWPRRIAVAGLIWAVFLSVLSVINQGASPEDQTTGISILLSGVYTLLLYWTRSRWLFRLADHPLRNAMILGSVNAAVIETLFWGVEKIIGASGVAASPNLIVDLLMTMPWYVGMVIIFVRVQHVRRFSPWIVLLLGGLYEIGADGLIGGGFSGGLFSPAYWLVLPTLYWWLFIPVYSSMVLPPAWLIARFDPAPSSENTLGEAFIAEPGTASSAEPPRAPENRVRRLWARYQRRMLPRPSGPAWRDVLRPLLWVLPYLGYLVIFVIVAGVIGAVV
jgi:hypothetical protein